jgi:signal transduction histidine kinase
MPRLRWSLILATAFLGLLGWYLVYTEQIVRVFRSDISTMTRMFAEVQAGLADPDPARANLALVRLQEIILESGVPLVLSSQGDTILAAVNLPFEANLATPQGQRRVQEYLTRLDARNPPVGDPMLARIHYGDPPELQRLRWIPWFQVAGLMLTLSLGVAVVRAQRRAESDQAWNAMARELAHQLGTPISSLQGWLEVLRLPLEARPGNLRAEEIADHVSHDVDRLERVSRRFELIGRETALEPLDLRSLVEGVERYLQARMPRLRPGARLDVAMEEGLPPVTGNAVLLAWALENLVKNALDALAGRQGVITLRGRRDGSDWVVIEVEDTGPGVDPSIRDRLFDPGVSTKTRGWGVGLSLTQRIVVRIHHGKLRLLRTGSEGSVFEIRLPVAGSTDVLAGIEA